MILPEILPYFRTRTFRKYIVHDLYTYLHKNDGPSYGACDRNYESTFESTLVVQYYNDYIHVQRCTISYSTRTVRCTEIRKYLYFRTSVRSTEVVYV